MHSATLGEEGKLFAFMGDIVPGRSSLSINLFGKLTVFFRREKKKWEVEMQGENFLLIQAALL